MDGSSRRLGRTPDLYSARGYANTFTDRYRVSLFGNANNTNQELWYNGDGSTSSYFKYSGKNAFHSPGGTLFWRNKSDENAAGYLKIEATGDYNNNTRRNTRYTELETMLSGGSSYNATEEHPPLTRDARGGSPLCDVATDGDDLRVLSK